MTGNEITIGSIGISVILSIVLRMIYQTWEISNRAKPWIAVGSGMFFAVIALIVTYQSWSGVQISSYLTQGFMTGATATGIYEMTKADGKPTKNK